MKTTSTPKAFASRSRGGERGAALITVLLVSTLLLVAGGALLMTTSMSASTAVDTTAEVQAYSGAEAGMQDALNVLRGNVAPNPLPAVNPAGDINDLNKINFRRAVTRGSAGTPAEPSSNLPADPASAPMRLSRWLNYNYTSPGSAFPDRVTLTNPYTPLTGVAYSVNVSDPDGSERVTYSTAGRFTGGTGNITNNPDGSATLTFPDLTNTNTATINYTARTGSSGTSYPSRNDNIGSLTVSLPAGSLGAIVPIGTAFYVDVKQTVPWPATITYKASILFVQVLGIRIANVTFTKVSQRADGTLFLLDLPVATPNLLPVTINGGSTPIPVRITAPDPKRLLIQSTGFGPRGSVKRLQMMIGRSNFAFDAPATLTMIGADNCAAPTFDPGASNAKKYSGSDESGVEDPRPAFAVTACDVDNTEDNISKHGTIDDPEIGVLGEASTPAGVSTTVPTVPVETPSFLKSADAARDYLNALESLANTMGRYRKPATAGGSISYNEGTKTNPVFTFVDGDCTLGGGAGFLVVTGTLTMSGNPSFDGIVLVMGGGSVVRNGGGNGDFMGAMVISRFARTWPATEDNIAHPFLAPTFNTNGGGNSTMQYNSVAVSRAMNVFGFQVVGMNEY